MRSFALQPPVGAVEIHGARTINSKTYDLGNGKRSFVISMTPMHIPDDIPAWAEGRGVKFSEEDTSPVTHPGNKLRVPVAWYGCEIPTDAVGFDYTSKLTGGTLSVRLLEVGGSTFSVPNGQVETGDVWWRNVATQLDFNLRVRAGYVEMFKRIRGQNAPRSFLWQITESADRSVPINHVTAGWDNADLNDVSRVDTGPGRIRRRIVMNPPVVSSETTNLDGTITYTVLEEWSGNTVALDANRIPSVSTDVSYPVQIDILVTENIAATADDGFQTVSGGAWDSDGYGATGDLIIYDPSGAGNRYLPGWRFQTVAIPQGTTTDDATLTVVGRVNSSGTGAAATLYGNDVDDAPAWANNAGPVNMTKTTASVSFGTWGNNQANPTTKNLNVKSICDEIFARAGWASGNDIAFGVDFTENNNGSFHYFDDLTGGGSPGVLTINYTAAGGTTLRSRLSLLGAGI